jgi:hypothetical protein
MENADQAAVHAAYLHVRRDPAIQFDFSVLTVPQIHLPHWLEAFLRGSGTVGKAVAPVITIVFWAGVGVGVLAVVLLILTEVMGVRLPDWRRSLRPVRPALTDFAPDRRRALALLEDADRLAGQGRFDEAARLILRRGIEDIEARRPRLVRPALTAREIASLADVPATARACFAGMAAIVERSAFAGRTLGLEDFGGCRAAYERFAFAEAWA